MVSLNDVCYEQIKDNFYYGLFGDFKLVIDKSTECFNATKLCNFGKKRFVDWNKTLRSKKLIEYFSSRCDDEFYKDKSQHTYEIKGDNKNKLIAQTTGQYLPPELLDDVIHWIKTPRSNNKEGVVYIITTSSLIFNNVFKIGYTKNFGQRLDILNDYRHSSEPQFFPVAVYTSVTAKQLETKIHRKLHAYRCEGEFFQHDLEAIKSSFEDEECELENVDYHDHDNVFSKVCKQVKPNTLEGVKESFL
jgi:KilA-N domain/Meiotically up-regulated gene 113